MSAPSPPLLLIFNADTCSHCQIFLAKRKETNQAIKEKYPNLRYIWVTLDKMDVSVLSPTLKEQLQFFPICIYYGPGEWEQMTDTHMSGTVMTMADTQNGLTWGPEKIMDWLEKVAAPRDEWMTGTPLPLKTSLVLPEATDSIVSAGPKDSPVLVIYLSDDCHYCTKLTAQKSGGMNMLAEICSELRDTCDIRFCTIRVPNMDSKLDPKYPTDLGFYRKWYPMFILVPGPVFDQAMVNPKLEIREGVQILNGKWADGEHRDFTYQMNDTGAATVSYFTKWARNAMTNPEFIRASRGNYIPSELGDRFDPPGASESIIILNKDGSRTPRNQHEGQDLRPKAMQPAAKPENNNSLTYSLTWNGTTYTLGYDFKNILSLKVDASPIGSVGMDLNILSIINSFRR